MDAGGYGFCRTGKQAGIPRGVEPHPFHGPSSAQVRKLLFYSLPNSVRHEL